MKKRSEISSEYKWDLSDYFKSDEDWKKAYNDYSKNMLLLQDFNGKLKTKSEILKCLRLLESLNKEVERLFIYTHLIDTDVANEKYQIMFNKMMSKLTEFEMVSSFINPQLSQLSDDFLEELYLDKDFKDFSRLIFSIKREKAHVLDEKCERLLSGVSAFSDNFSQNHSNFENADLKFKDIKDKNGKTLKMSQSDASIYLRSDDDILRENAYKELQGAYGRYNNFLTSNYLGSVQKDVFFSKARGFASTLEERLFYNEVDKKVYDNLIKNVERHLDLNQAYFESKRKLLGLNKFKLSDVYYNPIKISNQKYTYEEACDLVVKALGVFGAEYTNYLRFMMKNRYIDVFPNENKRGGAYETIATGLHPIVLLNFMGTFNDVSTMAHELGHAMHSVYSTKNQSVFHASYTIFLAEIASTVNETLLNEYMLSHTEDSKEKIYYLNEFLQNVNATIFRQTMFADFEKQVHEKVENNEPLSAKILNSTYLDLVKKFFGNKVKLFDEVQFEWSRIPHFFTSFYVYQYATGLISAINIVINLLSGKITVDDYKKFLSSGCTDTPTNLLKIVKVDYDSEEPFENAFKFIEEKCNMFKSEIGKITKKNKDKIIKKMHTLCKG